MRIELTGLTVKDLNRLERGEPKTYGRILTKINHLVEDPDAGKPLVGPLKGVWSLRVGDWRILYEIGKAAITILTINHRREVYK